jgi:hypothetical protein
MMSDVFSCIQSSETLTSFAAAVARNCRSFAARTCDSGPHLRDGVAAQRQIARQFAQTPVRQLDRDRLGLRLGRADVRATI